MTQRQQGFTLIEVLVATTISALLLASAYGIFSSVSAARDRLEKEGDACHLARVIFDRLGRELRCAFFGAQTAGSRFSGGTDKTGRPYLELVTTAATPLSGGSGLVVVRYRQVQDEDLGGVLLRDEFPLYDKAPGQQPDRRLAAGIADLRLRFHRNGEWQDQWQANQQGGMPDMVEVTLAIAAGEKELPFVTAFELTPLQQGP
jgi:general secretion pathway protein J